MLCSHLLVEWYVGVSLRVIVTHVYTGIAAAAVMHALMTYVNMSMI